LVHAFYLNKITSLEESDEVVDLSLKLKKKRGLSKKTSFAMVNEKLFVFILIILGTIIIIF